MYFYFCKGCKKQGPTNFKSASHSNLNHRRRQRDQNRIENNNAEWPPNRWPSISGAKFRKESRLPLRARLLQPDGATSMLNLNSNATSLHFLNKGLQSEFRLVHFFSHFIVESCIMLQNKLII